MFTRIFNLFRNILIRLSLTYDFNPELVTITVQLIQNLNAFLILKVRLHCGPTSLLNTYLPMQFQE